MKLAIDASSTRECGGLTFLNNLLFALSQMRSEFDSILLIGPSAMLAKIPIFPGLTKIAPPAIDAGPLRRMLWSRYSLPGLLKANGSDILFVPGAPLMCATPCPAVIMVTNMLIFDRGERQRYGLDRLRAKFILLKQLYNWFARGADLVVFPSKFAAELVQSVTTLKKYAIVPHGVDQRFFLAPRPQDPPSAFSSERPFKLLYVSTIAPYKHHEEALRAVLAARAQGLPVLLRIVGGGEPRFVKRLLKLIAEIDPAQAFIEYVGAIPYEEIHHHYHQADAFLFASSCECWPHILIEAMASGLPIMSSGLPPMPEAAGDACVYFDPNEPESIHDAIRTVFADHELRHRCATAAFFRAASANSERTSRLLVETLTRQARAPRT